MKYPSPMLYVVIGLAFVALVYIIYIHKQMLEGFTDNRTLAEKFQTIPDDQKVIVCKTLSDQLTQLKSHPAQTPDVASAITEMNTQIKTIGC